MGKSRDLPGTRGLFASGLKSARKEQGSGTADNDSPAAVSSPAPGVTASPASTGKGSTVKLSEKISSMRVLCVLPATAVKMGKYVHI